MHIHNNWFLSCQNDMLFWYVYIYIQQWIRICMYFFLSWSKVMRLSCSFEPKIRERLHESITKRQMKTSLIPSLSPVYSAFILYIIIYTLASNQRKYFNFNFFFFMLYILRLRVSIKTANLYFSYIYASSFTSTPLNL